MQNSLIEKYLPVARAVAARYSQRFPNIDRDDFYSAAYLGIVEAHRRYDATRGTSFAPFARTWATWSCAAVLRDPQHDPHHIQYDEYDRGQEDEGNQGAREAQDHIQVVSEPSDLSSILHLVQTIPHAPQIAQLLSAGYTQEEICDHMRLSEQKVNECINTLRDRLKGHHVEAAPCLTRYLSSTEYARKSKISLKRIYEKLGSGKIEAKKCDGHWKIPVNTPLFESTPQGLLVPSTAMGLILGLKRERAARQSIERVLHIRKSLSGKLCHDKRIKKTNGRYALEILISPQIALQVIKQSRTSQAKQLQRHLRDVRNLPAHDQLIEIAKKISI